MVFLFRQLKPLACCNYQRHTNLEKRTNRVLPPLPAADPGDHSTRMVEYSHEDIKSAPGAGAAGRRRPQHGPNTAFCLPSHRGVNPHQGPCAASSLLSSHGPRAVALAGFTRTYHVLVQLLLLKMGVSTCRLYPALEPQSGASIGLLARGEAIGHHHIGTHTGRHRPLRHRTGTVS